MTTTALTLTSPPMAQARKDVAEKAEITIRVNDEKKSNGGSIRSRR